MTKGLVLEKELHIENIWTVLQAQSSMQRAKVFSRGWARGRDNSKGKPDKKKVNPYLLLDWNAEQLFAGAKQGFEGACETNGDPEGVKRWDNEKTRNKYVARWIKNMVATEDCKQLWANHVPALSEPWGKESFKYYRGLLRPQSSMLLHCRTEIISLNLYLNKIKPHNELREPRRLLQSAAGTTSYAALLTHEADIAAEWAISYFGIEQFDDVRERASRSPLAWTLPHDLATLTWLPLPPCSPLEGELHRLLFIKGQPGPPLERQRPRPRTEHSHSPLHKPFHFVGQPALLLGVHRFEPLMEHRHSPPEGELHRPPR
ncbi:hypothetical protein CDV31_014652 [Fusarium ambrosium]|uniref:Uncharacterized protein n=1 Tax=Fusarium ambrosium TaxID=131363 RepID=A0A428SUX3_9HYPO|nr:hypothetical protein CDV31_014652 [Fusarium ambrosium]